MKPYVFDNWIGITIPDQWSLEVNKSRPHLQIYDKDGVGVILVSFIEKTKKDKDLKYEIEALTAKYMKDVGLNFEEQKYRVFKKAKRRYLKSKDDLFFTEFEYNDGENYWRVWHVLDQSRLVFITYNCDIVCKNEEKSVVDEIIRSIDFVD